MEETSQQKHILVNEPKGSIAIRAIVAFFLMMSVLLVVLLSCLIQRSSDTSVAYRSSPITRPTTTPATLSTVELLPFPVGQSNVVLDGANYVINSSVDVTTIVVQNNAVLTVADLGVNSPLIRVRTKYLLIQNGGGLHIGTESHPYLGRLEIVLWGKQYDADQVPAFGGKFIGVTPTGTVEIHGPWKLSWTFLAATVLPGVNSPIITVDDDVRTWSAGDNIVIASSSDDMNQAEVFSIVACSSCNSNQVKLNGTVRYQHLGVITSEGVDVRAEVGLLSRNIKIYGEMENSCYQGPLCKYFSFDTYGGSFHILHGSAAAHIEGVELFNMGQQLLGRYPIHFHRVFEVYGFYARQLSIHDCFSRCVTLHAAIGLEVSDVVGYNVIGHCFFLEDGNEQDNRLVHNLGLVTKPGSLLPADRDEAMCLGLTQSTAYNYTPIARQECMHVSTFWISHPNNTFINNSAAGSTEVGYFVALYREPTGFSSGTLPPFDGERSPLQKFWGNRAHSNPLAGFLIDRGVKITNPSPRDPRDYLALVEYERYAPHVNKNLSLPRAPANIARYVAYNNGQGIFARGGDVWISDSKFLNNDIAVVFASSPSLPYDAGSHQALLNSTVVGCSSSHLVSQLPCVGVMVLDGPILVDGNRFSKFESSSRPSYVIGFYPNNSGQNTPANTFGRNVIDANSYGIHMGDGVMDGDLTQILYDLEGSLSGVPRSYIVRSDNQLLNRQEFCQRFPLDGRKVVCNSSYGQLFVNVSATGESLIVSAIGVARSAAMVLNGVEPTEAFTQTTTTQYQPVLQANQTYKLQWTSRKPPSSINLSIYNFRKYSFVKLRVEYPANYSSALIDVSSRLTQPITDTVIAQSILTPRTSLEEYNADLSNCSYYWDRNSSALQVTLVSWWSIDSGDQYNYCPQEGCYSLNIATV